MALTKDQKDELKQTLLDEKAKLVKRLDNIGIRDKSDGGGFRARMEADEDVGRDTQDDNATDFETYQVKVSQEQLFEDKIRRIDNALRRLYEDEFGSCEECGSQIAWRRLEQDPTLELCVKCSKNSN